MGQGYRLTKEKPDWQTPGFESRAGTGKEHEMIPDDYWANLDDILYRRTLPDDIAAAGDELRDREDWRPDPKDLA